MNAPESPQSPESSASLAARLDRLNASVELLLSRQRAMSELVAESGPIVSAMVQAGTVRLQELDDSGTFAMGRAALSVLRRVNEAYGPDDITQLGDAVVGILDTVRNLTQSDVLQVVNDATDVLGRADRLKPIGLMGAMRQSRDEDVQRGIAVLLEVLKQVGKVSGPRPGAATRGERLARHLAPSSARKARPAPIERTMRVAAPPCEPSALSSGLAVPGFALDDSGFLVDPASWTEEFAVALAPQVGVAELTPSHWQALRAMRAEYEASGKSPNVRKLGQVSGLGTKALYTLFKSAPGSSAARIAGVPKPVGCL